MKEKQEAVTYPFSNNIEEILWGKAEGKSISLYKLTAPGGMKMNVTNYGAIIQSLFVKDKNGIMDDVVLGYDSLTAYVNDPFYIGAVAGRYANRIAGGTVHINGEEYHLHTREGGYHLHGGNKGFNKKVWTAKPVVKKDACGIEMNYLSIDGEEGFPGNMKVQVTYWLNDKNQLIVDYTASTDRTTLLNITQHSYFNLAGHASGSVLDHEIILHSSYYLPVNKMQVPSGKIEEVDNTPFNFLSRKKIGERIKEDNEQLKLSSGYDHSWILENEHSPVLKHAATVYEPVCGRKMDVYTTQPAVHFYTGNFLDGSSGKNRASYKHHSGFCLETQHFPDAPNKPDFPSTVLHPGEVFKSQTIFEFSLK